MAARRGRRPGAGGRGHRRQPQVALTSASPNAERVVATTEVGGEDDLAPARRGEAVDGDDHGLAPLPVGVAGEAAPCGVQAAALAGVDGLEVGAGAEDRPLLASVLARRTPTQTSGSSSMRSMAASISVATAPFTACQGRAGRLEA